MRRWVSIINVCVHVCMCVCVCVCGEGGGYLLRFIPLVVLLVGTSHTTVSTLGGTSGFL